MPNTNKQSQALETVLLLDARNTLIYQFTFDVNKDKSLPERFIQAVCKANVIGKSNDLKRKGALTGRK